MPTEGVELRLSKIRAGLAQDLVGLPQLAVLALQRTQLLRNVGGHAGALAAVNLGFLCPIVQRLRGTADLGRNRLHRCPARRILADMLQHHPHRALAHLR